MTRVRQFVVDLAKAGKRFKEIDETVKKVYGDKAMTYSAIYKILRQVKAGGDTSDRRKSNSKKTKRTLAHIASIAAAVDDDRRISVKRLALMHDLSVGTVFTILHKDLSLSKKSARWVPKNLTPEQKEARVRTSEAFVKRIQQGSFAMLKNIVTMDETLVSYHTPETKNQSKEWTKKGQPGPLKSKMQETRNKQMALVFFDAKGVIYTNIVPKGAKVNADYIVKALRVFMRRFRLKRPELAEQEWFFHWDNAPVHTAAKVQEWIAANGVRVIEHPPYSPDLAPADFFLFQRIKAELGGMTLTSTTFKKTWDGVI